MPLTTHHLRFTATALTTIELDDQAGSAIRGALVGALWGRFCANQAAPTCADCPLLKVCPVAFLVAPMREAGETGGEQRPRPYVTRPPAGRHYNPGEELVFGVALFGQAAQLFPYIVMAAQALEEAGLGRRQAARSGQRGTLHLSRIEAIDPLYGTRQVLYERGVSQVHAPGLPIAPAAVAAYAHTLSTSQLTLHFHTPLRLIDNRQLVRRFALRPFLQRLAWRLDELSRAFGDTALESDHRTLADYADQVQVIDDKLHWRDVVSYSSRQGRSTPIGGLVGHLTLAGNLAPLRELLVWGMLLHVGKNAVKGDGWYSLVG